jgi:hypothetical protein
VSLLLPTTSLVCCCSTCCLLGCCDRELINNPLVQPWAPTVGSQRWLLTHATGMDFVEGLDNLVAKQWKSVWPTISGFHHRTEDAL